MDREGYKTHLCVAHQIEMKYTLIIAFLTLYASTALGEWVAFYESPTSECNSDSPVYGFFPSTSCDMPCLGFQGKVQTGVHNIGIWAGRNNNEVIETTCIVYQSPDCTGDWQTLTSGATSTCPVFQNAVWSAQCSYGCGILPAP